MTALTPDSHSPRAGRAFASTARVCGTASWSWRKSVPRPRAVSAATLTDLDKQGRDLVVPS